MKIKIIHNEMIRRGLNISYGYAYAILTGRTIMTTSFAHTLASIFKEKTIDEWKNTTHQERFDFFYAMVPEEKKQIDGHTREWKIKRLKERFGPEIIDDLKSAQTNPFFRITSIGDKYNITRERACQIYEIVHGKRFSKDKNVIKKEPEIICRNNPLYKAAEYKKLGHIYRSALIEKLFMCKCEMLGYDIEIPCNKEIDIVVNGYKIEIKSSFKPFKLKRAKTGYYRFNISVNQRQHSDFIACYVAKIESFFIIPNEDVGKTFNKTKTIYIQDIKDLSGTKYYEYKDRFDLLKKQKEDIK